MEITGPNNLKLNIDESVFELIKLIKPTHPEDACKCLEGPLWTVAKRTYKEKLVSRHYHLINHHLYVVRSINGVVPSYVYLRVSGRGNINEVTKDEAFEVIKTRVGYVEDSDLADLGPNTDPEIPYRTATCDF